MDGLSAFCCGVRACLWTTQGIGDGFLSPESSESIGTLYLIDDDDPGANDDTVVNKSFTLFRRTFFEAVLQFKFKRPAGTAFWSCPLTRSGGTTDKVAVLMRETLCFEEVTDLNAMMGA
ncbi:hypothetical protein ARMGADRAFT_1034516 [Armillaria gallica]|uniref:Uncharacterized protein n=1 Tax=Armillaria gallica TaxID=47427 RepID=A0A2H3CY29_ARMGA|nr:hypothetical protein ARMGADRAFT_1034516 [Armillaria gallica]